MLTIREELEKLIANEIADRACQKIMRDTEDQNYDLRNPYWREELHEYMQKRGVFRDLIEEKEPKCNTH